MPNAESFSRHYDRLDSKERLVLVLQAFAQRRDGRAAARGNLSHSHGAGGRPGL